MADEEAWKGGCTSNPLCDGSAALVDKNDCTKTIATISGISSDFKDTCENGLPDGEGGAGGGS